MTAPQTPAPSASPPPSADRAMLLRSASLAWTASTVLLAVGALLTAGWLWAAFRSQQQADDYGAGFGSEDSVSLTDRVDMLLNFSIHLLAYAAIVIAAAFALRLLADLAAVRAGGFSRHAIGWGKPTEITLDRDEA